MRKKEGGAPGKFKGSVKELERALTFQNKAVEDPFYFAGIAKSFEICLEYAWKELKRRVIEEGLEAFSPKEAIRLAGRLGFIDNVEKWLDFLEDRNLAVHDYLGISNEDYLQTIREFLAEAKKII